jgi:hypothetical protein
MGDGKMRPIDDRRFKGLPLPAGMPVTSIGDLGWNALLDLEYPALVLHEDQLVHNITTMADYCRHHRVELAPHAKTSLSPQLIRRQMAAGAWGRRPRLRRRSGVCWLSEFHVFSSRICSSMLRRSAGS